MFMVLVCCLVVGGGASIGVGVRDGVITSVSVDVGAGFGSHVSVWCRC